MRRLDKLGGEVLGIRSTVILSVKKGGKATRRKGKVEGGKERCYERMIMSGKLK